MKRGYIRLGATLPSEEIQRSALASVGVDVSSHGPVYSDVAPKQRDSGRPLLPEREASLRAIRNGASDEWVIAEEGIAGLDLDDLARVLAILAEKGAVVTVVASGKSYQWQPELAQAIDFIREADHQRAKWRAAHARRNLKPKMKVLRGPAKEQAKQDWLNNPALSGDEVAAKWEVGVRTLYNLFGPRNTPLFGKPKGRRK